MLALKMNFTANPLPLFDCTTCQYAWPAEFEPTVTDMVAEFKAGWIAEYGQWTDPETA